MSLLNRIAAVRAALAGRMGRKIITYDHHGDDAALLAHMADVRQLEVDGYEVLNIIREHAHEGLIGPENGFR